jgi:hypothetical protein
MSDATAKGVGSTTEQDNWLRSALGVDLGKHVNDAKSSVSDAVSTMRDAGTDAVASVADTVTNVAGSAGDAVSSAESSIGNVISSTGPIGAAVVDGVKQTVDFNKGVVEGAYEGVKGIVTGIAHGVASVAKEGYELATDAQARSDAVDTVEHAGKAVGDFEVTMLTDPGKALDQAEGAAESGAHTVTNIAKSVYKSYEEAAAAGHGAEFLGKAVGQGAVLVGGALIPGVGEAEAGVIAAEGAVMVGEGAAVLGEGTALATEGATVLGEGAALATEGAAALGEGTALATDGAAVGSEGTAATTEAREAAMAYNEKPPTLRAPDGEDTLAEEVDDAFDNATAGPLSHLPAQDPADPTIGLQSIEEPRINTTDPNKISFQQKMTFKGIEGTPEGRDPVEFRYHAKNPNAPEGTYSHDNPTAQVNTQPELKPSGKPKPKTELYKLPDGAWKKISQMTEAEKAQAHYGEAEQIILRTRKP